MTYNTAWPHRPVLTGDLSESSRAAPRPAPGTEATIASRFGSRKRENYIYKRLHKICSG